MDRISQLHDELLLDILSFLPTAKDVVSTMVLSKRWKFLWMMVPKLVYDDSYQDTDYERFSRFVDRSLILHKAPFLTNLHFKLGRIRGSGDTLVKAADKCCVRKLSIDIDTSSSNKSPVTLPKSLYSRECRMLMTLELRKAFLVDVSTPISFPSLKKLTLKSLKYPSDGFFNKLISSCPVLEYLNVKKCHNDNVTILSIRVPSLKCLFLDNRCINYNGGDGFVIDAPSLESLEIVDYSRGFRQVENNMCKIVTASVDLLYPNSMQIMGSLASAKRLFLCLPTSKADAYPGGIIFHSLLHLTLCTCETEWLNVLIRVLRDSPNLRTLTIKEYHCLRDNVPRPCWNKTSLVPEYLLPSLETFKWVTYRGTKTEKEVVAFILRIASCLKQATIITSKYIDHDKKLEMLNDFPLSSRRSQDCLLAFSWTINEPAS